MKLSCAVLALFASTAAYGADRGYSTTEFDRIRVEGPYAVTVEVGKPPSAKATGKPEALDRLTVRVQNRVLIIRQNINAWGERPAKNYQAPSIKVGAPSLRTASIIGTGKITINKMRNQRLGFATDGSGVITVGAIIADRIDVDIRGSSQLMLAGKTAQAYIRGTGSSTLNAQGLAMQDLELGWQSSGEASGTVTRAAKIDTQGSGNITIDGEPACTVNASGSGIVSCGGETSDQ
jgi:Putative auto-transporter adhesin, head GIN domain